MTAMSKQGKRMTYQAWEEVLAHFSPSEQPESCFFYLWLLSSVQVTFKAPSLLCPSA
jgi:hypothetical protein